MRNYQTSIYEKPATQVNIRYVSDFEIVPWEYEIRIDWEGRNIGCLVADHVIDTERKVVPVWVWDSGGEKILFELPGEDVNATGRRLWASREWLERVRAE